MNIALYVSPPVPQNVKPKSNDGQIDKSQLWNTTTYLTFTPQNYQGHQEQGK
jgi:hypothetical protein